MPRLALVLAPVFACGDAGGGGATTTGVTSATDPTTGAAPTGSTGVTPTTGAETTGGEGEGSSGSTGFKYDVGLETDTDGAGTACRMAEAAQSNQGCEFWAVDLPNAWQVNLASAEEQPFAIVAANTGSAPVQVAVYAGAGGAPLQTAEIGVDALHVFSFDNTYGLDNRASAAGTAYRVESDAPVTVYQFNPLDNSTEVYSNDASLLFPTHVLGADYTAITGDAMRLGTLFEHDNAGAFVTVVAAEDGTQVQFYPPPGVPLYPTSTKVTLDRGETYTLMSNAVTMLLQNDAGQGNLSGTRVAADRPVAVFSGNVASFEPTPNEGCCADHLEHQMLPLSAWGSGYVVVAAAPNSGAQEDRVRVRITGSFDGTQLSYSPAAPAGAPATIDAYETAVFFADAAFTVSADQPFAVTEFLLSNSAITVDPTPDDDADDGFWPGDPAMIVVPPAAQFQSRYVFLVPEEYAENFVTVVRPAGAPAGAAGE
jgi:hypothetical protein